jgi:chemotaxis protein methyltransferase CheR
MITQVSSSKLAFREYDYSEDAFTRLQRLIHAHCGISLSDDKKDNVYSRLSRRLRALGLDSFCDYCRMIEDGHLEELEQFTNALTTNLTGFFREAHHFEYLRESVIPEVMQRNAVSRRLRIWSAGCSSGEEPYSIAMTLLESIPQITGWDVRILATELDTDVLDMAKSGIYSQKDVRDLSEEQLKRGFQKGRGSRQGMVRVAPDVRRLVTFRRHNLMHEWPMQGPFDIIFCRNVVIYFDKPTQQRLFNRFADIMAPGGHLFIGHSESLNNLSDRFKLIGRTIYRRNS